MLKVWYLIAIYAIFHFCLTQFIANYDMMTISMTMYFHTSFLFLYSQK